MKKKSGNFATRENEPGYFVTESKEANTPSPKNGYVDCAASLQFGLNLHTVFVNVIWYSSTFVFLSHPSTRQHHAVATIKQGASSFCPYHGTA